MKGTPLLLLTSVSVIGQLPDTAKVIDFDRSDREHCSVVVIAGKPMLQSAYGGTSVAVGLPVSTADGDFRVFVVIRQTGPGKTQVKPKEFSALYSDPAHTRFSTNDKASEVDKHTAPQETQEAGIVSASSQADPAVQGVPRNAAPEDDKDRQERSRRIKNEELSTATTEQEVAREEKHGKSLPGTTVTPDQLYLRPGTLRQGSYAEGFVYFAKPKGSKLAIGPRDLLFEIDIPLNGVVFRFS